MSAKVVSITSAACGACGGRRRPFTAAQTMTGHPVRLCAVCMDRFRAAWDAMPVANLRMHAFTSDDEGGT